MSPTLHVCRTCEISRSEQPIWQASDGVDPASLAAIPMDQQLINKDFKLITYDATTPPCPPQCSPPVTMKRGRSDGSALPEFRWYALVKATHMLNEKEAINLGISTGDIDGSQLGLLSTNMSRSFSAPTTTREGALANHCIYPYMRDQKLTWDETFAALRAEC
jgi:hypothetical protein